MKPAPFDYYAPASQEEALHLLAQHGEDAKLLAGGQSLIPLLNLRLAKPRALIDLNALQELSYIRASDGRLAIGAMTRQRALERSPEVAQRLPMLRTAMEWIAHPQVRNRGTIGGSLAHADPAAELPALALAHDATLTIIDSRGARRSLQPQEFFVTYLTTALQPDDLLTEVSFPALPPRTGWSFMEIARRHGDFALAGVCATVTLDARGRCLDSRLVLFGVGATPVRAAAAERALLAQRPDGPTIEAAAAEAAQEIDPPGDVHATAAYRCHVAGVLVRRALTEAVSRVR